MDVAVNVSCPIEKPSVRVVTEKNSFALRRMPVEAVVLDRVSIRNAVASYVFLDKLSKKFSYLFPSRRDNLVVVSLNVKFVTGKARENTLPFLGGRLSPCLDIAKVKNILVYANRRKPVIPHNPVVIFRTATELYDVVVAKVGVTDDPGI
jgi:hypothetical protein